MPTISAYIIAFNEAAKIKAAVESVLWADEIVVADSHSTDGTAEIAAGLGARVVQIPFQGFGELRHRALPLRLDFQPGLRRALHRRAARRDFGADRRRAGT